MIKAGYNNPLGKAELPYLLDDFRFYVRILHDPILELQIHDNLLLQCELKQLFKCRNRLAPEIFMKPGPHFLLLQLFQRQIFHPLR
ncbi:hypothetical protein D3C73_342310 [compost metagenome]